MHARRTYERFLRAVRDAAASQERAFRRAQRVIAGSEFDRRYGISKLRDARDLRRAAPLHTYEDLRPIIERVAEGELTALFSPREPVHMFATSSGTTARPKLIPVTSAFVADYRRGWNTFGLKMLSDHPAAVLRSILQASGRYDASRTSAGIPCGAITGLLAQTQKRIVRKFYVGRPEIAHLEDATARYYVLMRLGVSRDVAFAITANPSTLIQMARTASDHGETLIRDVRDGTISTTIVADEDVRRILARGLKRDPARARELERLRSRDGALRPRDYWRLEFLACWTGGSMGHYLQRLADWWGPLPVRDVGLLASEGRITIPLEDGRPAGVLDVTSGWFEFIPVEYAGSAEPLIVAPRDLEPEHDYIVVLTNTTGLIRYRLDDVVRVRGALGAAPLLEFRHRAGRVASIAGEKLTENQTAAAVTVAKNRLGLPEFDFVLAPVWDDPPYYRLHCTLNPPVELAQAVDAALSAQNEEYKSRRNSGRLGRLQIEAVSGEVIESIDRRLAASRGGSAEQYKRPCLLTDPQEARGLFGA